MARKGISTSVLGNDNREMPIKRRGITLICSSRYDGIFGAINPLVSGVYCIRSNRDAGDGNRGINGNHIQARRDDTIATVDGMEIADMKGIRACGAVREAINHTLTDGIGND